MTRKSTPAALPETCLNAVPRSFTAEERPVPAYADGPLADLMAAEAIIDLLRLGIEQDFMVDFTEASQDSGVVAAGHALYLVRRARLAYAEALATAINARSPVQASAPKRSRPR